ncbi:MAG: nuclear transport factor 2 family protein [Hyphomicrobiales bacterium]
MTPLETVHGFVDQINVHDVAGLAALMTPDHRFIDSLGTVMEGRERMREGWRQYLQMVPDYRIDVQSSFVQGTEVALLGSAAGTYSRGGQLTPADAWRTPAAWRALVRNELVAEWQVYADNEPIRQRMRKAPA